MGFPAKWLCSLTLCFLLYPLVFVLWHGNYADEFVASALLMLFLQFISPLHLWLYPACAGTLLALVWTIASGARRKRRGDGAGPIAKA